MPNDSDHHLFGILQVNLTIRIHWHGNCFGLVHFIFLLLLVFLVLVLHEIRE